MEEEKSVSQVQVVGCCCYSKYQVMKTGKQERKKCQAVAQIEALLVRCRSTERSIYCRYIAVA
jgi:hypothetical protein